MPTLVNIKGNVDVDFTKIPENVMNGFARATLRAVERWLAKQEQEEENAEGKAGFSPLP